MKKTRYSNNVLTGTNLLNLPEEVVSMIIEYVGFKDAIQQLTRVNSIFLNMCYSNDIWKVVDLGFLTESMEDQHRSALAGLVRHPCCKLIQKLKLPSALVLSLDYSSFPAINSIKLRESTNTVYIVDFNAVSILPSDVKHLTLSSDIRISSLPTNLESLDIRESELAYDLDNYLSIEENTKLLKRLVIRSHEDKLTSTLQKIIPQLEQFGWITNEPFNDLSVLPDWKSMSNLRSLHLHLLECNQQTLEMLLNKLNLHTLEIHSKYPDPLLIQSRKLRSFSLLGSTFNGDVRLDCPNLIKLDTDKCPVSMQTPILQKLSTSDINLLKIANKYSHLWKVTYHDDTLYDYLGELVSAISTLRELSIHVDECYKKIKIKSNSIRKIYIEIEDDSTAPTVEFECPELESFTTAGRMPQNFYISSQKLEVLRGIERPKKYTLNVPRLRFLEIDWTGDTHHLEELLKGSNYLESVTLLVPSRVNPSITDLTIGSKMLRRLRLDGFERLSSVKVNSPVLSELAVYRCLQLNVISMIQSLSQSLTSVRLGHLVLTDEIVSQLKQLPKLTHLELREIGNTPNVTINFPNLVEFCLISCKTVKTIEWGATPSLQLVILDTLPILGSIEVINMPNLEFIQLTNLRSLQTLKITDNPKLEQIILSHTPNLTMTEITGDAVKEIHEAPKRSQKSQCIINCPNCVTKTYDNHY